MSLPVHYRAKQILHLQCQSSKHQYTCAHVPSWVHEEGNIWFLSKNDSDKNLHIAEDSRVQLFYSNGSNYEYLSIYGTAEILNDREKIKELWTPIVKAWFKEGEHDPSISLLKVTPIEAYYWDTKNNKIVSLIKIAISAITGVTKDDGGVEGTLKV